MLLVEGKQMGCCRPGSCAGWWVNLLGKCSPCEGVYSSLSWWACGVGDGFLSRRGASRVAAVDPCRALHTKSTVT